MAEASLKLGGDWGVKEGSLLGFNDQNGNYKPIPFDFTRATTATRVNRDGLIEEVQANVPRIDFLDNPDGALLLEPQRTNNIPYSEYFNGLTLDAVTVAYNVISPENITNAATLTGTGVFPRVKFFPALSDNTDYCVSVFVKSGTASVFGILAKAKDGSDYQLECDLSDGSTTSVGTNTPLDLGSVNYGNGWYRFYMVYNSLTGATSSPEVRLVNHRSSSTNGWTNGLTILAYGGMHEQGSYATSYIKTSGSAVTRNADNTIITSADDLIGQTEGTMFFEGSVEHTPENVSIMNFDRSTQYSVVLLKATNGKINAFVFNGGLVTIQIISEAISGKFKCAVAYKSGDTAFYVNGTQIGVNATTFTPAAPLNKIYIGSYSSPYFAFDHPVECNQALVFKTRLTNEELAALTTI